MQLLKYILIPILFFLLNAGNLSAQQYSLDETLSIAKSLRDKGEIENAAHILADYNRKNPGNIYIMRLYAETLFWLKEYDLSDQYYSYCIEKEPNNIDIYYEYSLMLFEWNKYNGVINLLEIYTNTYDNVASAESLLGISYYYEGEFKKATTHLEKAQKLNPDDGRNNKTLNELYEITKPWINFGTSYSEDSQPLNSLSPEIRAGNYFGKALNLSLMANVQRFTNDSLNSSFLNFRLQNHFLFPKAGFSAKVFGGLYKAPNNSKANLVWGAEIHQRLAKNLFINALAESTPYTFTHWSIDSSFSTLKTHVNLEYSKSKSWNAKAGYMNEIFGDNNNIQTMYAWGLSPEIKLSVFGFYFGYAFSYADSKETRLTPETSLDHFMSNYLNDSTLNGFYIPYFTPHEQFTHLLLFNVMIYPIKNLELKLHSATAVYATALNPYFYLDTNNGGKTFIKTDYYTETYTPYNYGAELNYHISNKLILRLEYSHIRTYYFDTDNFSINLNYRI